MGEMRYADRVDCNLQRNLNRCTEDNQVSKEGIIIANHLSSLDVPYSEIPAAALSSKSSRSGIGFGFLLYIHGYTMKA